MSLIGASPKRVRETILAGWLASRSNPKGSKRISIDKSPCAAILGSDGWGNARLNGRFLLLIRSTCVSAGWASAETDSQREQIRPP